MTLVCLAVIGRVAGLAGAAGANDKVKVLIVDGQNNHNWKVTTPIMQDILVNCGRFTVDVATSPPRGKDMAPFRPALAAVALIMGIQQPSVGGGRLAVI